MPCITLPICEHYDSHNDNKILCAVLCTESYVDARHKLGWVICTYVLQTYVPAYKDITSI